jgi:hypothetical protein
MRNTTNRYVYHYHMVGSLELERQVVAESTMSGIIALDLKITHMDDWMLVQPKLVAEAGASAAHLNWSLFSLSLLHEPENRSGQDLQLAARDAHARLVSEFKLPDEPETFQKVRQLLEELAGI